MDTHHPGDCIDYDRIRDDILRDAETFNIRLVGFDTWNATPAHPATGAGLDVEPFPQTYLKFSPVAKSFEVLLTARWCAIVAIRFWHGRLETW